MQDYSITVNHRLKYARIKVKADQSVEVVVPLGFDRSKIERFVHEQGDWISQAQNRLAKRADISGLPQKHELPETFYLAATDELWTIKKISGDPAHIYLEEKYPNILEFTGGTNKTTLQAIHLLRDWTKYRAKVEFTPLVAKLASEMGVSPKKVATRIQKTRWGSCSSSGTITLNARLLFVDPTLVRSVIFHELAHITHMNHSKEFWLHLSKFDPNCHINKTHLNRSSKAIPNWMLPTL